MGVYNTYLNSRLWWIRPERGIENRIKNPTFSHPTDPYKNWTYFWGHNDTIPGLFGLYAARLKPGANDKAAIQTTADVASGFWGLSFYARYDGHGYYTAKVEIYDTSDNLLQEIPLTLSPSWKLYLFDNINVPSGHTQIKVRFYLESTNNDDCLCLDAITLSPLAPTLPFSGDSPGCAWLGDRFTSYSVIVNETPDLGVLERFSDFGMYPTKISGGGFLTPGGKLNITFDIPGTTYDETLSARTMLVHYLRRDGTVGIVSELGTMPKLLLLHYEGGLESTVLDNGIHGEVTAKFSIISVKSLAPRQIIVDEFPTYRHGTDGTYALFAIDELSANNTVVPISVYVATDNTIEIRAIEGDVNGHVYVGGKFRMRNTETYNNGIFILRDRQWGNPQLLANDGIRGEVFSLLRHPEEEGAYVGGQFSQLADGTSISQNIAWYNGSSWVSLGSGVSNPVKTINLWGNYLVVLVQAGTYVELWKYHRQLGTWNRDTTFSLHGTVHDAVIKGSYLHIVGEFDDDGWKVWNLETSEFVDHPYGIGLRLGDNPGKGYAIDIDRYGVVYVVGNFDRYGYLHMRGVVSEGLLPIPIGETDSIVYDVCVDRETNDIYIVGSFTTIDDTPITQVAIYQGRLWYQYPAHIVHATESALEFRKIKVLNHTVFLVPKYTSGYTFQGPVRVLDITSLATHNIHVSSKAPLHNVAFKHLANGFYVQLNGVLNQRNYLRWIVKESEPPQLINEITNTTVHTDIPVSGPVNLPVMFSGSAPLLVGVQGTYDDVFLSVIVWPTPGTLGD